MGTIQFVLFNDNSEMYFSATEVGIFMADDHELYDNMVPVAKDAEKAIIQYDITAVPLKIPHLPQKCIQAEEKPKPLP